MLLPRNRWIGFLLEEGGVEWSGRGDGDGDETIIIYHSLEFKTDIGLVRDHGKGIEQVQDGEVGKGKAP